MSTWQKDYWFPDKDPYIYVDSYGWAWGLNKTLKSICLGRADEVIKRIEKERGK